jgi:hypothetical protein
MKITKRMLKQIIKEELRRALHEDTWRSDDPEDMRSRSDFVDTQGVDAPGQSRHDSRKGYAAVMQVDIFSDFENEIGRLANMAHKIEQNPGAAKPGEAERLWKMAHEAWKSFTQQWSAIASASGR